MTKTEALRHAKAAHSGLYKTGHNQWRYTVKDERGRSETNPKPYAQARQSRAASIAAIAATLLGIDWFDAQWVADHTTGTAKQRLDAILAKHSAQNTGA